MCVFCGLNIKSYLQEMHMRFLSQVSCSASVQLWTVMSFAIPLILGTLCVSNPSSSGRCLGNR